MRVWLLVGLCFALSAAAAQGSQSRDILNVIASDILKLGWRPSAPKTALSQRALSAVSMSPNSTLRNATRPPANPCAHSEEALLEMMKDQSCLDLLSAFEPDNFSMEAVCDSPCFDRLSTLLHRLHMSGCVEGEVVNVLSWLCISEEECLTQDAKQCVDMWIDGGYNGSPSNDCDQYLGCAVAALQQQQNQEPSGCCVKFGYGARMVPCCHKYHDNITSHECSVSYVGAGVSHHPNMTCAEVQAVEGLPAPAEPVVAPSDCLHLNNCSSHGQCVDGVCVCDRRYGRSNSSFPQDCSEKIDELCPSQCSGHGVCKNTGVSGRSRYWECHCDYGFNGPLCNIWNGCQSLDYCNGNGICSRVDREEEECHCHEGYQESDCRSPQAPCPHHCSGQGQCHTQPHGPDVCSCYEEEGQVVFGGPACNRLQGPMCENHCSGWGRCGSDGRCECVEGATGEDCSVALPQCTCGHGYCRDGQCECVGGFTGQQCNRFEPSPSEGCGPLNMCSGRGVCGHSITLDGLYKYQCTCFQGFEGPDCSRVSASACPNYCSGHGRCVLSSSPHCECQEGWLGRDCNIPACPESDGVMCGARGVCENRVCVCDEGWGSGALGACEVSRCGPCVHGQCKDDGTCECHVGYVGDACDVTAGHSVESLVAGGSDNTDDTDTTDSGDTTDTSSTSDTDTSSSGVEYSSGDPIPPSTSESEEATGCINLCSGHGDCVANSCQCYDGYSGVDCSGAPTEDVVDPAAIIDDQ